jgi:hypothetical protein
MAYISVLLFVCVKNVDEPKFRAEARLLITLSQLPISTDVTDSFEQQSTCSARKIQLKGVPPPPEPAVLCHILQWALARVRYISIVWSDD